MTVAVHDCSAGCDVSVSVIQSASALSPWLSDLMLESPSAVSCAMSRTLLMCTKHKALSPTCREARVWAVGQLVLLSLFPSISLSSTLSLSLW